MTDERALRRAREHGEERRVRDGAEGVAKNREAEDEVAEVARLAHDVAGHLADLDYAGIQVVRRCERKWWGHRKRYDDAGWEIAAIRWNAPDPMPIYLLASGELIVGDGHTGIDPIRWHPPTVRWSLEKLMAQYPKRRSGPT